MQVNSTISFTGKKPPKKPKTQNRGLVAAGYLSSIITGAATRAATAVNNGEKKMKLDYADTIQIKKGIQEGLKNSGLYDKGVRVYRMQEVSPQAVAQKMASEMQDLVYAEMRGDTQSAKAILEDMYCYSNKDKKALNAIKDTVDVFFNRKHKTNIPVNEVLQEAQDGGNTKSFFVDFIANAAGLKYKFGVGADYLPGSNKIVAPDKSLQTSIFHEMGHALNNNGSVFMKALQKSKPVAQFLPGIIFAVSLLNKRKVDDEQLPTDSKLQRLKDGVKRNAGKLTALAFAPMILEEGIASVRGGKIAEDLFKKGKLSLIFEDGKLSKEIINKVRLTNVNKFAGSVLIAAGTILGTKLAIKVKDKLQAKYETKQDAKYQAKLEKYNQKMLAKEAKKAQKTTMQA